MNLKRMSDQAIVKEIGNRIRKQRLLQNYSQSELATRAGISISTMQKLEYGTASTIKTVIQALRVLGKLESLNNFIPEPKPSPIEMAIFEGKQRKRASKRNNKLK
ncbi:MAG: helix-turn-helix transcriptional regulator [Bacteroidales bacterium]|nr:helix-turn-helix transcriptional regulator [Bacteroidales bacterium]